MLQRLDPDFPGVKMRYKIKGLDASSPCYVR